MTSMMRSGTLHVGLEDVSAQVPSKVTFRLLGFLDTWWQLGIPF